MEHKASPLLGPSEGGALHPACLAQRSDLLELLVFQTGVKKQPTTLPTASLHALRDLAREKRLYDCLQTLTKVLDGEGEAEGGGGVGGRGGGKGAFSNAL